MAANRSLISLAILAGALAACGAPASGGGPSPLTPLSRWELQVEPGLDRIALAVRDGGLSANQHAAINALASRYRAEGASEVVIETPSGDDPTALQTAWAISEAVRSAGVPASQIRMAAYHAPNPRAPVLIGYTRLQAVRYDCSSQWGDLVRHANNQSAMGLGCSTISNMAAQIADPRDIAGNRPMDPADAGRRTVVLERYRQGEPTQTQSFDEGGGEVATAID